MTTLMMMLNAEEIFSPPPSSASSLLSLIKSFLCLPHSTQLFFARLSLFRVAHEEEIDITARLNTERESWESWEIDEGTLESVCMRIQVPRYLCVFMWVLRNDNILKMLAWSFALNGIVIKGGKFRARRRGGKTRDINKQ
jgi:hypothetical protein